ncbi:MAG: hypothetical protein KKD44_28060, partial [Proteobacteria bacterium]|nr:hypothetical protein [Pseudomonadota bacterium]
MTTGIDRNLDRVVGRYPLLPEEELASLRQQQPQAQEQSGWTQFPGIKQTLGAFEWVSEHVEKPVASLITSRWSPPLRRKPGESWMAWKRREYEEWDSPWGAKGLAEMLPWMIPIGGTVGLAGRAATRVGLKGTGKTLQMAARSINTIERAAAYPITKPISLAAKVPTKLYKGLQKKVLIARYPFAKETLETIAKLHPERTAMGTGAEAVVQDAFRV